MTKDATEQDIWQLLHEGLADHLLRCLREGETVADKEGNTYRVDPKPATLNVIRQFLRDNNVEAPDKPGSKTRELANELPFDDEENGNVVKANFDK